MTDQEFKSEAKKKSPTIQVLSEFKGVFTKVETHCLKCGSKKSQWPSVLLKSGPGCAKCNHNRMRKSHEDYVKDLQREMPGYSVLEPPFSIMFSS